ncbi:Methylmalonate-semialdehyde dehydrogenase [acylating] mitochondrial [Coelomomyces lativittatus]|nr:Methylmalonate-semialdehyde dehydrogenase [acylating] mitochondrial [Coelomomyces lativittatus]
MLPPPESTYSSKDEMLQSVKAFAITQGYALTILHSDNARNSIVLKCDRGGKYTPSTGPTDQVCTGSSQKVSCPFQLHAQLLKVDGLWHVTVTEPQHNHKPSSNMAAHASTPQ